MPEKTSRTNGGGPTGESEGAGGSAVSFLLIELDASLKRMERASESISDGETIVNAAALASEVDRLCWRLSVTDGAAERERLHALVIERLDSLQTLLGVH